MENFRTIKLLYEFLGGGILFLSIPLFVFGYSDTTTHPALTKEIARFFNYHHPERFLDAHEIGLLMKGSIDEDEETRWLRHFFDPVHDRGLTILGKTWESSKDWSQDTLAQAEEDGAFRDTTYGSIFSLFSSPSDYSWERAIYDYAWIDEERGLESLGHILHLLEDATVPDHTRNDPHPNILSHSALLDESPYESWTAQFGVNNTNMLEGMKSESNKPRIASSLNDYFNVTANYSNNNFFSKDTIFDYTRPTYSITVLQKLSDGLFHQFGYAELDGIKYKLIQLGIRRLGGIEKVTTIEDADNLITADYWALLSKEAIKNGAGLIKLFFDEVEKEKQTRTLWLKNRSWWQKAWDWSTSVFSSNTVGPYAYTAGVSGAIQKVQETAPPSNAVVESAPDSSATVPSSVPADAEKPEAQESLYNLMPGNTASVTPPSPKAELQEATSTPDNETAAEQSDDIDSPPWYLGAFVGGGGGGAAVSASDGETSDTPSSPPSLEGEETTEVGLLDEGSPTSTPDETPPDVSLTILECSDGFSEEACAIGTTTLTIALDSSADDAASYSLACLSRQSVSVPWAPCEDFENPKIIDAGMGEDDSASASSTATTTRARSLVYRASSDMLYEFRARAKDGAGNESAEVSQSAEVNLLPVIINEIAWMGTGGSATTSKDEWIELKSRVIHPINLSGWQLELYGLQDTANLASPMSAEPKKIIPLSGAIQPKGYFLIERTNDDTLPDISADIVTSFGTGLHDSGMVIKLARGSTIIDQTLDCPPNWRENTRWCAGNKAARSTMERVNADVGGAEAGWGTYYEEEIARPYANADGEEIFGTPKERNSATLPVVYGHYWLRSDKTLTKENSPYVILRDGLMIDYGASLTIEPGVVVKIASTYDPKITVHGALKILGTKEDPVVITSIRDDEFGGDTNKDGICSPDDASSTAACPYPGSWKNIFFDASEPESRIVGAIIRYGGRHINNFSIERQAMIVLEGVNVSVSDSIIEHSQLFGIGCLGCASTVSGNMFRLNAREAFVGGGGAARVIDNEFIKNGGGIAGSNFRGGEISRNRFIENNYAIRITNSVPFFEGNSISPESPGKHGIELIGHLEDDTFLPKDLTYIVGDYACYNINAKLTIEKGVVIKFPDHGDMCVYGSLVTEGTEEEPVVFTAFADDEYGGDTNNNATTSQASAGTWSGISIYSGPGRESILNGAIIRYGGGRTQIRMGAGLMAEASSVSLAHSIIENNSFRGVWFKNSSSTVYDTLFRNNSGYALIVSDNATSTLENAVLRNNAVGITVGSSSHIINNGVDIDDSNAVKTEPPDLFP